MKLLYDTQTGAVLSWPRGDEEDVVGLASHLLPVEAIDQPLPDVGRWQVISAAAPQVDVEARTVTRGWVVTDVEPVVTMRSLRFALVAAELYNAVYSAAMSTTAGKVWWESSQTVRRHHPFVAALGEAIGQTTEQINALFEAAAQIETTL
jgi:hypothetical protein